MANITYKIYGKDRQGNLILVSSHTFINQKYRFDKEPKKIKLIFDNDNRPSIPTLGYSSYYTEFPETNECKIITDDYDGVKSVYSTFSRYNLHKKICADNDTTYHHHELIFDHNQS
jgi:hypothetical protein